MLVPDSRSLTIGCNPGKSLLVVLDLFKIRGPLSYTACMFRLKVDLKYILLYIDF